MIYFYFMILVTGGTGLVGSHLLVELVKKAGRVRALKRKNSNTEETRNIFSLYSDPADSLFTKIEWVEGDLMDIFSLAEALEGITHVYHCAALVSLNQGDRKKMILNNVTGTANLVNTALEKKVIKFCHVSSVAALGITPNGKEITEETYWNDSSGLSAYTLSKYESEQEVWRAQQEGLDVVVVNPSIIIGPGNWHRSSGDIFRAASKGLRWYTPGEMGFVDVRDVVNVMIQLMESNIKNEKFIVSSENISFRKFTELLYESMNKRIPNKKAGKFILWLISKIDRFKSILTGSQHLITKDIIRYAGMNLSFSNKKIKNALGIAFIPINRSVKDTSLHFLSFVKQGNK